MGVGQAPAQLLGHGALVLRVAEREEQADRDRLRVERPGASRGRAARERRPGPIRSRRRGSARAARAARGAARRAGRGARGPGGAGGGGARSPSSRRTPCARRCRSSSAFVATVVPWVNRSTSLARRRRRRGEHRLLLARRGRHLRRPQAAAVEQHGVGEGAADIDPEHRHGAGLYVRRLAHIRNGLVTDRCGFPRYRRSRVAGTRGTGAPPWAGVSVSRARKDHADGDVDPRSVTMVDRTCEDRAASRSTFCGRSCRTASPICRPATRRGRATYTMTLALPPREAANRHASGGPAGTAQSRHGPQLGARRPRRTRQPCAGSSTSTRTSSGFYRVAAADPDLAWAAERRGPDARAPTVFEDVVKTICTTNCAWSATVRMVTRWSSNLGEPPRGGRGRAFPTPAAMAE